VVGAEVAEALNAPLDVLVVRKLGVPWQPELAVGAIAGGSWVIDYQFISDLRISNRELEEVIERERREMARRQKLYRDDLPAPDLCGRTVVLVDDGLATGSTMIAAARHVRTVGPRKIIVAVPVASSQAFTRLKREVDDYICLAQPEPFFSVGEWYDDFRQVSDREVQEILRHHRSPVATVP